MLKFYVRHVILVDKIHEIISFKQSKWLEKYINFKTQKRNKAKMILKKNSINYLTTHFTANAWKKLEIVRDKNLLKKTIKKKL